MNFEELNKSCQDYADSKNFLLQPDEGLKTAILKGLLLKEEKFGKRYCPCRVIVNNPEEDDKIVCPCVYHEQEIIDDGVCKCRLFLKKQ